MPSSTDPDTDSAAESGPDGSRPGDPPPAGVGAAAGLLGAASLLAIGNIASRVLGLAREQVIAGTYAVGLEADAFSAVDRVPAMIYDLLIGGMLSSALVPVLSAYASTRRDEFWRVVSTLLTLAALVTGLAAAVVMALAGPLARLLVPGDGAGDLALMALVASYLRVVAPAVLLFGVAGMMTGVLYARGMFGPAAAAAAVYNLGLIVSVLALHDRLGGYALPLGVALGAVLQVAVLLPGLRGGRLRPSLDWRHPALRRILLLYLPIGAGLLVSNFQVAADTRFASEAGEGALSTMRYATRLIQFPHGLVSVAISLAILPALSAAHARRESRTYRRTLARGLRMVLALTLPAAVGLAALADPVVGLVFQRWAFTGVERTLVTLAVYGYVVGLPFVAIDWPLNYAFYARQNTLVPALVGLLSVAAYMAAAVALGPALNVLALPADRLYLGLVVADSVKHACHALVMVALVARVVGRGGLAGVGRTTLLAGSSALAMGGAVWGVDRAMAGVVGEGTLAWAARVGVGGALGLAIYLPLAARLRVEEIGWLANLVRARLAGRASDAAGGG